MKPQLGDLVRVNFGKYHNDVGLVVRFAPFLPQLPKPHPVILIKGEEKIFGSCHLTVITQGENS
jgi:hypothetical protein